MKNRWEDPPEKPKVGVDGTDVVLENEDGDRFRFDRLNTVRLAGQLKSLGDASTPDEEVTDLSIEGDTE